MAKKIHELAPSKELYKTRIIPFAGGLGEFWNWDYNGVAEIINDVDKDLTTFYEVIRDPLYFKQLQIVVSLVLFNEIEFKRHRQILLEKKYNSKLEQALAFFIVVRQSMMGGGKSFAAITTNRVRREMQEQVSAYLSAIEGLPEVHNRLQRVLVLNRDAIELICDMDGPNVLWFLDPPYMEETRTANMYRHEYTAEDHKKLLDVVLKAEGFVMLCGYNNVLYQERLSGWRRETIVLPNSMQKSSSKELRTECLWLNYLPDGSKITG